MAPFELTYRKTHPLRNKQPAYYGHLEPTPVRYPPYSAGFVPYRWMKKENLADISERFGIETDLDREPEGAASSPWVRDFDNETALLDGFAAHLKTRDSLCFFYAKHTPFLESGMRVLVGVGRVTSIAELGEYAQQEDGERYRVWERSLQHSIRPNGEDGFLMPYGEILERASKEDEIDPVQYAALVSEERLEEFRYVSELVSQDGAVAALLSLEAALARIESGLGIRTQTKRQWLSDELVRIWKLRGPCPGFIAVLRAFGFARPAQFAHALDVAPGADPWPSLEARLNDLSPESEEQELRKLKDKWDDLSEERHRFLKLLSRFDLSLDQVRDLFSEESRAAKGWSILDRDCLENPYRLYEIGAPDGIPLLTLDRGIFAPEAVADQHSLDIPVPFESSEDSRRVRAFAIAALEAAAKRGHTINFADTLATEIRQMQALPQCRASAEHLAVNLGPELVGVHWRGLPGLQLERYETIRQLVAAHVDGAAQMRNIDNHNWQRALYDEFGAMSADPDEQRAQEEKAAALKELAQARFSVLVGPAGTGKTTVLRLLCARTDIAREGVLLLAPTGKARVRLKEGVRDTQALTIAQFLNKNGRYEAETGRYKVTRGVRETQYRTVIIDEASMITEEMLGAVIDAVENVDRFILAGDASQLPPIGAGKPFVDLVNRLRPPQNGAFFPRVGPGYAELTVERRQAGQDRPDIRLARYFSLSENDRSADVLARTDEATETLRFVQWDTPDQFWGKLLDVLVSELKLKNAHDVAGFDAALGAQDGRYFNRSGIGNLAAVRNVDAWQVLTPVRGTLFGVTAINKQIHEQFRKSSVSAAEKEGRREYPRPLGAERIVYGDKVINLSNHRREEVHPPKGALKFLANGEIGIVVGERMQRGQSKQPTTTQVELESQKGFVYDFTGADFVDDAEPALELAYALTIHKSQGSEFKLVILVVPRHHPLLSRELLYTALTRHTNRIVIIHQGPRSAILDIAEVSEVALRRADLLRTG